MRFFQICTSRIILNKNGFGRRLKGLFLLVWFVFGSFFPSTSCAFEITSLDALSVVVFYIGKVCPERMTSILQSVAISCYDWEISYHYRMNELLFLTVRKKDHVKHTGKASMKYESWKSIPANSIMHPWQMPKYNSWEAQKLVGMHTSVF